MWEILTINRHYVALGVPSDRWIARLYSVYNGRGRPRIKGRFSSQEDAKEKLAYIAEYSDGLWFQVAWGEDGNGFDVIDARLGIVTRKLRIIHR